MVSASRDDSVEVVVFGAGTIAIAAPGIPVVVLQTVHCSLFAANQQTAC
jgi:hypothetical protein